MNETDFPAFPATGTQGPDVCATIRFYLAIVDDLPFEQVRLLSEHMANCEDCTAEFRRLQKVTRQVAALETSAPSARVDEAILAAIQRYGKNAGSPIQSQTKPQKSPQRTRTVKRRTSANHRWSGGLLLAAALVLLILGGVFLHGLIFSTNTAQVFQIPSNLNWNGYVLHYTQNETDSQGKSYRVEVYQDLGSNQMHIESSLPGQFDVVVVTDNQTMLGKDMMHHVAQMGDEVADWAISGSLFNLTILREDLSAQRTTYLGQTTYQGQEVYLMRANQGQVLLLNKQYLPINVLKDYTGPGTGTPLYQTFTLMQTAQVSDAMWDMQVPSDFHMGSLPRRF